MSHAVADPTALDAALLERLLAGEHLTRGEAADVLGAVMDGDVAPARLAALLVALRAKGLTGQEVAGFVSAMVDHATTVDVDGELVDTCGTGGDHAGTFNISTLAAIVVAAADVPVAKHGNRSASSRCGSADLLEALGVVIDLDAAGVATTIRELGIGFLFARTFHPAMRHVAPVRGELGIRTVFNVLGPLSNPAGATHQVVGVADLELAPIVASALADLGKRALVFRGSDGLDELTTTGPSDTWEVRGGMVTRGVLDPSDVGIRRAALEDLKGGDVADNVAIARHVLAGEEGPQADVVALNAGAALYVAGASDDLASGVERARWVLTHGAAGRLLEAWVARSQELAA